MSGLYEGLFREKKERLRGIFVAVLSYLKNCYTEDRTKEVSRERIMATILSCNATGTFSAVLTGGILRTSSRLFVVFFFFSKSPQIHLPNVVCEFN